MSASGSYLPRQPLTAQPCANPLWGHRRTSKTYAHTAAAKLRQSQAGEDPPPTATEDGSLTESTFFGAGSGAKSKLKLKRAVAATVVANRMVER